MNKIAITSNFLAFLLFLFEKFSLLDSDPHIEFRSGYWMLILIQEVKWMRIHADPDLQPWFFLWLYNRVSQYVPNCRFFNVFIFRQAHLHPKKVTKQANFRRSLQNSRAKIENCTNFFARSCTKTVKDREPIFCSNVIWSK